MTSTIKILQVIPRLGFGGAETGCYDLAHFLAEKNCKSFLITSGGELLKYIRKDKVKVIRLPVHSKNQLLMLIIFIIISIIILVYNIDIVHARSRAPAWSCFLSCFFTKRKFVTTFHGTYNFSSSIKLFYNSIMLRAELIIAGSNFIFNHINSNYQRYLNKKKKLMVIFRGINLDYFSKKNISDTQIEKLLIEWKIEKNKKIILLPGRLTRWKGQEVFIEALSILAEEHGKHEFHAVILGSDQGRSVYSKKLIVLAEKNKIKNKLSFIKHCKNMPAAYKISDIVVSSSIEPEAFGRVSVEAQAMNVPIIASNLGGSMETILDNRSGFLFESGNCRELASVLNSLMELDKDAIHKIGVEGRKNVTKKFNVDQMCQTTFTEYQKLLK